MISLRNNVGLGELCFKIYSTYYLFCVIIYIFISKSKFESSNQIILYIYINSVTIIHFS